MLSRERVIALTLDEAASSRSPLSQRWRTMSIITTIGTRIHPYIYVDRSINKYVDSLRGVYATDYGEAREVCEIRGRAKLVHFGTRGNGEINNGGQEREREEVIILPRSMNNLHSLKFK